MTESTTVRPCKGVSDPGGALRGKYGLILDGNIDPWSDACNSGLHGLGLRISAFLECNNSLFHTGLSAQQTLRHRGVSSRQCVWGERIVLGSRNELGLGLHRVNCGNCNIQRCRNGAGLVQMAIRMGTLRYSVHYIHYTQSYSMGIERESNSGERAIVLTTLVYCMYVIIVITNVRIWT